VVNGRDHAGRAAGLHDLDDLDLEVDLERLAFDPAGYVASIEDLAGLLVEERSLEQLLGQVLELTSRAIETSAAVSVTVLDDRGEHTTAAASSDDARAVDDAQYALDEGPCVEALRTGIEQRFDDLTELDRWPLFRERAQELGFGSVFAVPLRAGGDAIGCLNVFAAEANGLSEDDRTLARRIAAPAASTLANGRAYRRVSRLAEQLQVALDGRAVIERAKGVLIAHTRCSEDQAFERLRRASQEQHRPLREIAAEVVARAKGPRGVR
jgi:transcriptional regulator with GAF, ATPase, and Fis domain